MLVLAEFPSDYLLIAGVVLVTTWAMMRLRQRRQRTASAPTASEQLERNRQARGLRGDLEQVMVEVEQLAKRFSAQLDAKSVRLEKLIEQADQRIATLQKLETPDADPPPQPQQQAPADDELTQNVYRLADAGNDSIEIARTLGEHVGKVELILALRQ